MESNNCEENDRLPNYFHLSVEVTPSSEPWLSAMLMALRIEQIVALFPAHLGVEDGGSGTVSDVNHKVLEKHMDFYYSNFDETRAEFMRVGKKLEFPPGMKLMHNGRNAAGERGFTLLHEW